MSLRQAALQDSNAARTGIEARFRIIEGTFHVKAYAPDGDSIRFKSRRKGAWNKLKWHTEAGKTHRYKQLRLEGIDALETHFLNLHQPRAFALGALEHLLAQLGIEEVVYGMTRQRIIAAKDGTPGFIATHGVDEFDRPVALLFPPTAPLRDGQTLRFKNLPMEQCINLHLLKNGLVYPTFYTTTDWQLAAQFAEATRAARQGGNGLWTLDATPDFTVWQLDSMYNDYYLFPKLFRRLALFVNTHASFDELPAFLAAQNDLLRLADGSEHRLDTLLYVHGRRLRLGVALEEVFFVPKGG